MRVCSVFRTHEQYTYIPIVTLSVRDHVMRVDSTCTVERACFTEQNCQGPSVGSVCVSLRGIIYTVGLRVVIACLHLSWTCVIGLGLELSCLYVVI